MEDRRKRKTPWHRTPVSWSDTPDDAFYYNSLAEKRPKFRERGDCNVYIDLPSKRAALKASPSVVALVSYSGDKEIIQGSGTIIESSDNTNIVLTSAHLIRRTTSEEVVDGDLLDNLKVKVHIYDGKSYEGVLCAHDFHHNLAAIRFQSETPLSAAILARVDDVITVGLSDSILRPHSGSFNLTPGVGVVAMGRYFAKPFDLMTAPGEYWPKHLEYDCKELFMTNCLITRSGDGGPLINLSGEVIAITYYDDEFTPCMPINVAYKWWEHHKRYREYRRPYLGMQVTNLYVAHEEIIDRVIQKFRSLCEGIIVEKLIPCSSADLAGIRVNDVIVECGGRTTKSFLEFFDIIWDNVGKLVDLVILRADSDTPLRLSMLVAEATTDQLNSWPTRNDDLEIFGQD